MKSKGSLIKALGIVASIGGVVATLLGEWVNEKKMDEIISTKLNEMMAKKENEDLITEDGSEDDDE